MAWKPANPFEQMPAAETPDEMRAEIDKAQQHHPLVRNVLVSARVRGLKGEDVYAMLAYHALQLATRLQQQMLDDALLRPLPTYIVTDRAPE